MKNKNRPLRKVVSSIFVLMLVFSSVELMGQSTLVASYPFDNGASDEHIHHYDGTVNGATLTTDRYGSVNSAYSFDGISNYISLPIDSLKLSNYSFSLWVKPAQIPAMPITPISFGGNQADQFVLVNNGLGWTAGSYNTTGSDRIVSSLTGVDTNWHHIVSTRENDAIRIYVDGILANSNTNISVSGAGYQGADLRALIGARCDLAQYFNGKIDEVKIFDGPLTETEVLNLFNSSSGLADENKVAFTIYPNPSSAAFNIQLANSSTNTSVAIFNMQGQVVYRAPIINGSISVHNLGKGIYFATIESGESVSKAVKIVIN